MFKQVSFKTKLLVLLVGINILIILFMLIYFPSQTKKAGMAFIYEKAKTVTKMTGAAASVGLMFEDQGSINDALNLGKQTDEFLFVEVFNKTNVSIVGINHEKMAIDPKQFISEEEIMFKESGDTLYCAYQIDDGSGGKLGLVVMGFTLENTFKSYQSNFRITLLVSVIMLIIMVIFSIFIGRLVTKPIYLMINRIKDIAQGEGDLTKKIDYNSHDEFGELASWFNIFMDQLRKIIIEIKSNVTVVDKAVVLITDITNQLTEDSKMQNSQIHQVASAIEEITSTIIETSNNANQVSEVAQIASDLSVKGTEVVQKAINEIRTIADIVNNAAEIIRTLGKSSDEIGEVISVIDNIADQTNLLALNAAIEAARAGEQGRGFSVVADEVRKLAERTTNATKEIADMINNIQKDTAQAVESTEYGTKYVEQGVASSNEAGSNLGQIKERINTVLEMVKNIALAAREESSASEQISENVVTITEIINKNSEQVDMLGSSTQELYSKTESLRNLVGKFKLGDITDEPRADKQPTTPQPPKPGYKRPATGLRQVV